MDIRDRMAAGEKSSCIEKAGSETKNPVVVDVVSFSAPVIGRKHYRRSQRNEQQWTGNGRTNDRGNDNRNYPRSRKKYRLRTQPDDDGPARLQGTGTSAMSNSRVKW